MVQSPPRILVIKLGALGDFIQALGPMVRIRAAHPQSDITLLTTPAFAELGRRSGSVDGVDTGGRPRSLAAQLALIGRLRKGRFDRVYDLQTSRRSSALYPALWPRRPQWSGIARGASHPHANPARDAMHTLERQAEQLDMAGLPVASAAPPDLGFMVAEGRSPGAWGLASPYAVLIPGGSAGRLEKRWSAEGYGALAKILLGKGLDVGVIGGPAEPELAGAIIAAAGGGVDLTAANLFDIAALAHGAAVCVGNDTGPTHIAASAGATTVALFSAASDPALCAPRGRAVRVLRRANLDDLSLDEVLAAAGALSAL